MAAKFNAKNGTVAIDNTEMAYISFGYGGKTLIFLPGIEDALKSVEGQARSMAEPFSVFFEKYTVYMFSRKKVMPETYSVREMAADQAEAMRKLGIEKASVVGISMGGMIAMQLAIDYPEMVEKLVLTVTAAKLDESLWGDATPWAEIARSGDHKRLMIEMTEYSYSEARIEKMRKYYPIFGMINKPKSYDVFITSLDALSSFDLREEVQKISCPTLILGGEKDKVVGVQASYELHEKIAGSTLYVYPDYGHSLYREAKGYKRKIFDFLEEA